MFKRAGELVEIIRKSENIHIVTHIDADGIAAGAIASQTLKRLNKDYSIEFVKQLDKNVLEKLKNENHELVWFTDLGSNIDFKSIDFNKIVTDHHVCSKDTGFSFHLNPHLFSIDGADQISGAGTTYLVCRLVDKKNMDLSSLAVVGACGDIQDRKNCKLVGLNRDIIEDGKKAGVLETKLDIRFFGRETRPIYKMLQYSNDPIIPGLSGREEACISFLQELGIKMKDGDSWRRWIDLDKKERCRIISGLVDLLLNKGFGHKNARRLIGEVYLLEKEQVGTEVHDAKEFATLLNATARYGKPEVGINVCLGDRGEWFKKAQNLLQGHRHNLVEGLQFAKEEGIVKRDYLQFFHAGTGIRDTIVGIVTNMLLNSEDISSDMPLIGFADTEDGDVKVSARGTQELLDKGLDLSYALRKTSEKLGGVGGGHKIAAGATIPKGKEEEFLDLLEKEIKNQLNL
ncbi:MAG: DHH family phosphoesterase [Candidatus Thermoplasmatota archaeon]|nr:DHH family phosphoesterase [Candidatus Thermoplasmatota archaeon]